GSYNVKTGEVLFKAERISHWIKNGAQVSDTVHNFLVSQKLIEGKKKNVLSRKSPTQKRKEIKKA
ncbi:30S ribosomal protein S16, partial [Candidatus Nomurabacteria bacterium]|nr:30S ribosomal protein S16 [Candidatus Nomurabacteria bacterium]